MENSIRPCTHIMYESPEAIKATREYQQQVESIRAAIRQKYAPALAVISKVKLRG